MTNKRYSENDIDRIRILAGEGNSAEQIARQMGVTRNAICGICDRQKISLISNRHAKSIVTIPSAIKDNRQLLQATAVTLRAIASANEAIDKSLPAYVTNADSVIEPVRIFRGTLPAIERGCRYTLRDNSTCCQPKVGRTSYCAGHYRKIYEGKKVPLPYTSKPARFAEPYQIDAGM